jgi:hypothetical protein
MVRRCVALALFGVSALAARPAPAAAPPDSQPTEAEVRAWVKKLGSDAFAEREEGVRGLLRLRDVHPALEQARKAPDLETRRRAEQVIAQINLRNRDRVVARLLAGVNEDGLDQFIARMVFVKGHATEERWQAAAAVARALRERAGKLGWKAAGGEVDYLRLRVIDSIERGVARNARILTDGTEGLDNLLDRCFIVSSGSVDRVNGIYDCVLLIDGDLKYANAIRNSLVFCTGNVQGINAVDNSLIVALGGLGQFTGARNNCIDVKHLGLCNTSKNNLYLNLPSLEAAASSGDRFQATEEAPSRLVRLWSPARLGLALAPAGGEVKVATVKAGSAAARAGLRADDTVVAVDGAKVTSVHELRRCLLRKAPGESVVLVVRRGGREVKLTLASR